TAVDTPSVSDRRTEFYTISACTDLPIGTYAPNVYGENPVYKAISKIGLLQCHGPNPPRFGIPLVRASRPAFANRKARLSWLSQFLNYSRYCGADDVDA